MPKKKWERPKLVVLARGKPEEMVLTACKVNFGGGGPSAEAVGCQEEYCSACIDGGAS